MAVLSVVLLGSSISQIASATTNFALTVWLWQRTHHAMSITLLELCSYVAVVAFSPVGGVLTDRWGQRRTLLLSNLIGAMVIGLFGLYSLGAWHPSMIYFAMPILGVSITLQAPAVASMISALLHPRHYARANGLSSLAVSASGVAAPALGAGLYAVAGLGTILLIDVVTYVIAFTTVLVCPVGSPPAHRSDPPGVPIGAPPGAPSGAPSGAAGGDRMATRVRRWRGDLTLGFRYIVERPSLRALQVCFFVFFFSSMFGILQIPMILARTDGNKVLLAGVLSAAGIGGIIGGFMTTLFGIPGRRPVHAIFYGFAITGLLAQLPFALSTRPAVWWAASFIGGFLFPGILAAYQTIWQINVPLHLQGRVFAARRVQAESAGPLALLVAGPLADHVMEPAMAGRPLGSAMGWLVGEGPGAGMALLLMVTGLLSAAVGVIGLRLRSVRRLATMEPDPRPAPEKAGSALERASDRSTRS
ncbi:MAG TPA: MFS transporter [Streptosporangiaceae bacterium]|nr:MFS transporter [Streptosporangiaceae bacterium]